MIRVRHLFLPVILLLLLAVSGFSAVGQDNPLSGRQDKAIRIHFFYAENCPHCREEKPFLENLQRKFPRLEIIIYDVWKEKESLGLMVALSKAAGYEMVSTPTTILEDRVWIGFNPGIATEIEAGVLDCLERDCPDDLQHILHMGKPSRPPAAAEKQVELRVSGKDATTVDLPFFGHVEPGSLSLPAFTVMLGLVDSFNPCAFFVLIFLLGLLVHAHSRRIMLVIGGTFVFFSGFIYFLFMAAWLNLFLVAGQMPAITRGAGVVALVLAVINIKDYFFFKKGVSLSLSDKSRSRLFKRMRHLRNQTRIPSILIATVFLAVAANSYELLCTAGFPMIYTRVLTMHELSAWQHYAYLCLYNLVYVIPLLLIVVGFTLTLGSRKMSEWQGRVLKLLSGVMMLMLGLVLIVDSNLLSNLYYSLGFLVLSLMLTWLVNALYHHRRFNPEAAERKKQTPGEKIYRLEKRRGAKKKGNEGSDD
jgi:thiol-disulfide isomerase/thioredoxin